MDVAGRAGRVRAVVMLITSALVVLACSHSNGGSSGPPTLEDQCRSPCTPTKGHPCGAPDHTECVNTCVAHIEGRTDKCRQCILGLSGWHGTTCSCDKALGGFGNLTCTDCTWVGNGNGCSTDFSSCSTASSCSGYVIREATDPACAADCDVSPIVDAGQGG